tara:strand:- start:32824 stop:32994 length:171 start_codon:yes stop_codon:yes gene_type:complete
MSKSKGLGDSVEKFTKATGLKTLMEISMESFGVKKKDCGCNKRKKWLNEQFPYNNK